MTTFLPYPNFALSAYVLDKKRLGNQRGEALAILGAIDNKLSRIYNHAATRMWRGYTDALVAYGLAICEEWMTQGCEDNTYDKILSFRTRTDFIPDQSNIPLPLWFGKDSLHASHRGNLIRKLPKWYSVFGWKESPLLPYEWPMNLPVEILQGLRAKGYEPLHSGFGSQPAAQAFVKGRDEKSQIIVVAHNNVFYPCTLSTSAQAQAKVS